MGKNIKHCLEKSLHSAFFSRAVAFCDSPFTFSLINLVDFWRCISNAFAVGFKRFLKLFAAGIFLSVFQGGDIHSIFEKTAEKVTVLKSQHRGDLGDIEFGI